MKYRVIKPYTIYKYGFPLAIPVGSIGEWFEHGKCYCFDAIDGYVPYVGKWAVEAWHNYFEVVNA